MKCIIQYHNKAKTEWLAFDNPVEVACAHEPADVLPLLRQLEAVVQEGFCVAGYMTYEAASGLDPALDTHPRGGNLPLVKFGIYKNMAHHDLFPLCGAEFQVADWCPSLELVAYERNVARIKEWIASGDTYQVNFTFKLKGQLSGSTPGWFANLLHTQRPLYGAYIEDDDHIFCSASPELFFRLEGDQISCCPMKGTRGRGLSSVSDSAVAMQLMQSDKDRAENIMIVDMMRNDLGRIAETGTIAACRLFAVEQYPTLWQMVSTVGARTTAGFADIIQALFPCSSITGAPKKRTMEIIRTLEDQPRGIYTGTIGCLLPSHPATGKHERFGTFNVAIRTAHVQAQSGEVEYGTGSGIVWDSVPEQEHRECQTKALILSESARDFELLETLLWRPGLGWFLLREHEERLSATARYFDFNFDPGAWRTALDTAAANLPATRHRVRATLAKSGEIHVESLPLPLGRTAWRVDLAAEPVDQKDPFLYHKTTHRIVYDQILSQHPDADDVILWNQSGEITESCFANVIVKIDGEWYTPPVECGLLNGVLRQALVKRGRLQERIIRNDDLRSAERVLLINSVRGFITLSSWSKDIPVLAKCLT